MVSRRRFLARTGVAAGSLAGCLGRESGGGPDWQRVAAPTDASLHDAAMAKNGPYAVGEDGVVLHRTGDGGPGWRVVTTHGPHAIDSTLMGVATSDNGGAVWFCGASGVVGRYDVPTGRVTDHSAPRGKTSTWLDVGVVGLADREWVFLANGSGEVLVGTYHGDDVRWRQTATKPGGGASAHGLAFDAHGFGYVCDSTANVYETVNAGADWRRIGIPGASVALHDVAPVTSMEISVAGGNGVLYQFDGFEWTPHDVASVDLYGVARTRRAGLAVGASGTLRAFTAAGWKPRTTGTEKTLHGVVVGGPAAAVGESGTILERAD